MNILDRLRRLDVCAVSDALDALHLPGAVTGLMPLWPIDRVIAGHARTIRVVPKTDDVPGTHIATPVVASAEPDDVIVIANNGRVDVSCWGGILTHAAVTRGIIGVIIDGACRDIAESQALNLPVFGRAVVPVSARGRIVQEAMDVTIHIGTVMVMARDFVIADRNGIAFININTVEQVVDLAEHITIREAAMVDELRAGRPVTEVMHDTKFSNGAEASA